MAQCLKLAMGAASLIPTLMLAWNMAWTQYNPPQGHEQVRMSVEQTKDSQHAEFRTLDDDHPDVPGPTEPTTDSDWSELVDLTRQNPEEPPPMSETEQT